MMKPCEEIDMFPADDQETSEWIAVLAAAGLDYRLSLDAGQWTIHIPYSQADAARSEIAAYVTDGSTVDDTGTGIEETRRVEGADSWSPAWVGGMLIAFYAWIGPYSDGSALARGAAMDTNLAFGGEWWRMLTALTVHSGPTHLAGNVICLLLFGYAVCQTFGGGLGWAMILASGIAGNAAAGLVHGPDHISIGASTACFGALGILSTCQSVRNLRRHGFSRSIWSRIWIPIGAGFALLTLLGTGPQSDLMAHLFGFASGLVICVPMVWNGTPSLSPGGLRAFQLASLIVVMTAWRLVLVAAG